MKGNWKVTSNIIGEVKMYAVYRLIHGKATDHSGNREFATRYIDNRRIAEVIAEELNTGKRNDADLTLEEKQRVTILMHDYIVDGVKVRAET